ncbi:MAG: hypothetical protein HY550_04265 [Elusimicrobia bacterium]|nr:hypothetical protein [Elusimicrobiota bacterium]
MRTEFFPVKVILKPSEVFSGIAAGETGWGWPLGLYALSTACSALLVSVLPPRFLAEAFEGAALPQGRGALFYLAVSLPGGFLFTLFAAAVLARLTVYLREGRLALRLALAAAGTGLFGLLAAAAHGSAAPRAAGAAAALAALGFAFWSALRDKDRYAALLKAMLAVSALSLAGELAGGLAALTGSSGLYTASAYFFSLLSLIWLAKAAAAVFSAAGPRAANAAVLAILASAAFLFLLHNLRLLPPDVFQVLLFAA